ncbi:MAG: DUF4198 domain-containing protein [Deltaproteobacteria bacterium]|nr:DUF4198 domain-containing protein [Deltaproteobacteria bacterium]MDL1986830.1 DUF4198 domain-containing protein [Deltaproteobacteria bacterium]
MMRRLSVIIAVSILLILTATSTQAHMLWFNTNDYAPDPGETIWLEIGWGHKYPRHEAIKEGWIEDVYALTPNGKKIAVEKIFPAFYRFTPTVEGAYQIIAKLRSGFLSITTQGHKLGSKKDVTDVVSCFQYIMNARALIEVGGKKDGFSRRSEELLEIIPLEDPASLKLGDILPLKIMFQGKPLAETKLQGIYSGFKADEKNHWAVEKDSDSQGVVQVKLTSKGQWMFKTNHKAPYPDKAEADEYSYSTSLTVGF